MVAPLSEAQGYKVLLQLSCVCIIFPSKSSDLWFLRSSWQFPASQRL